MRLAAGSLTFLWLAAGVVLTMWPMPGLEAVAPDNAVPFRTVGRYLASPETSVTQVLGNLGLLAVVGFPAPVAWRWLGQWWRVALVAVLISTAIELLQIPIPGRAADVDDVILNTVGAVLVYAVWRVLQRV
jgi:glycopeptide antibiotics resistance protein